MATSNILTRQNTSIVELALQGLSHRKIGAELGISHDIVCNRLKRNDVKELVEYGSKRSALRIPAACDAIDDLLASEDEGIKYKAAELTFKKTGILAPHTQSLYIQNIYQDNRVISYSPHIQAIIDKQVDDCIDGEVIEDE